MITYRVKGFWLGPIITKWSTETEEQFEAYCKQWDFVKGKDGIYRSGTDVIEIKQEEEVADDTKENP